MLAEVEKAEAAMTAAVAERQAAERQAWLDEGAQGRELRDRAARLLGPTSND